MRKLLRKVVSRLSSAGVQLAAHALAPVVLARIKAALELEVERALAEVEERMEELDAESRERIAKAVREQIMAETGEGEGVPRIPPPSGLS